jgi:hypothetical protein
MTFILEFITGNINYISKVIKVFQIFVKSEIWSDLITLSVCILNQLKRFRNSMDLTDISVQRLSNQQIGGSKFRTPKEIAMWMGALQAQDYAMSKWAFGVRILNSTESLIDDAVNSGDIIRMHLLRPTWHFVSSDDVYWILNLTAPRVKAAINFRDRQLGLSELIFKKSNSIIEKSLLKWNHLTRKELISELVKEKIDVGENRASHLLVRAETEGIICSGKQKGNEPTYALLNERVPLKDVKSRDESLEELALRYFRSHGPATLKDFIWWSGLSSGDAKKALEMNKSRFVSELIEDQTYWFYETQQITGNTKNNLYLLPAYDEFLIGYSDRRASLPAGNHRKTVSSNGIFYPAIMKNGRIVGTWKRNIKKERLLIETSLFEPGDILPGTFLSKALETYAGFVKKELA